MCWTCLTAAHSVGWGTTDIGLVAINAGETIKALLPTDRCSAGVWNLTLNQSFRQFGEKHTWHSWFTHSAPETALAGMGQKQTFLRSRDADITEAALLLQ